MELSKGKREGGGIDRKIVCAQKGNLGDFLIFSALKNNTNNFANIKNSVIFVVDKDSLSMNAIAITPAQSLAVNSYKELTTAFVTSLDRANKTTEAYSHNLARFFSWVEATGRDLGKLTDADIVAYKKGLEAEGKSLLTINAYMVAIRRFYKWTEGRKLYPNIAAGVEVRGRKGNIEKQHLSDDKSAELRAYYQERSLRDFAIVTLMLEIGLRTIEICRLRVEDMFIKSGSPCLRIWGKGHKEADTIIPISWNAYGVVNAYKSERRAHQGEPLFTSQDHKNQGGELTPRSVSRICREGLDAIGLNSAEFTAHSLRHTAAVNTLKATDKNIYKSQYILRHASPATTEGYVRSMEEEEKFKEAADILNKMYN